MITTPNIIISTDPQLSDISITEIGAKLKDKFSWLDEAFGKVQKLTEEKGSTKTTFPAVHTKTEYLNLLPDGHIGNYCYFEPVDPITLESFNRGTQSDLKRNFGVVFWFNYKDVYPIDWNTRTIDNITAEILKFFRDTTFQNCTLIVESIEEETDNIYRGYSHNEIKSQFMMRPYRALRFNIQMRFSEKCATF